MKNGGCEGCRYCERMYWLGDRLRVACTRLRVHVDHKRVCALGEVPGETQSPLLFGSLERGKRDETPAQASGHCGESAHEEAPAGSAGAKREAPPRDGGA